MSRDVLITGGTGYMGSRLVPILVARGHRVRVLARMDSLPRVPVGAEPVVGDALDASSVAKALRAGDVLIHLVGTPHPSPSKAVEFRRVDLESIRASVDAARRVGISHLVYVSVARPAPVMKFYQAVRAEGERMIEEAGLTATVLRPWYVLGPGHWWPVLIKPFYAVAAVTPGLQAGARRLGLVTLQQMLDALMRATDNPPVVGTVRVVEVPEIASRRSWSPYR